jgi:hypothetical protein
LTSILRLRENKIFFSHYKDLEHKTVEIGVFKSKHDAIEIYEESVKRFKSQVLTPITSTTDISLTYSVSVSSINETTENEVEKIKKNNFQNTNGVINSEPKNDISEPLIDKNRKNGYVCCGCLQTSD